ncbi:MAG: damage-inducible protein DinB [Proteobacteria bacterium SG_bin6]|nr:MAG: damage-inducible protein DinB [Proteobacteria bacterium SG_bin6]
MITSGYLSMMARYNRWQNQTLHKAAAGLSDEARRRTSGAFWGSIHGTLSHLHWADTIWLSRFNLVEKPAVGLKDSATHVADWDALVAARTALDDQIVAWADGFAPGPVTGDLTWYSGALGREATAPLPVVLVHMFNHATHHRGQAHALITAAGGTPEDTDLFLMPRAAWPESA